MVAIALVALLATIVVPNFFRSQPRYERENFIAQLIRLLQYGQQHAVTQNKVQQIFVDFGKRIIQLRQPSGKLNAKGEPDYKQVKHIYVPTQITIPDTIDFKNFFIEGVDEFANRKRETTWFFIVPDGMVQEVTCNFFDTKDRMHDDKPRPIGLVLNPFTARFKEYDTFQK